MAKKLDELQKKIDQIGKLADQLGKKLDLVNLEPLEKNAKKIESLFNSLNDQFNSMIGNSTSLTNAISQLAQNINNSNKNSKHLRDTLNSVTSQLQNQRQVQDDIVDSINEGEGATKKLNKAIRETNDEISNTEKAFGSQAKGMNKVRGIMKGFGKDLENAGGPLGAILGGMKELGNFSHNTRTGMEGGIKALQKQAKIKQVLVQREQNIAKMIEKEKKLQGGLTDEQIRAGKGGDRLQNMVKTRKQLKGSIKGLSGMRGMLKGIVILAKGFGLAILRALGPIGLIIAAVGKIIEGFKMFDNSVGEISHGLGMNYKAAKRVEQNIQNIADYSGDTNLNAKDLTKTLVEVNQALGTTGALSEGDLKTFTKLREQAGMTSEEIMGMQKFSMATGVSLEENVETFQASAKIASYNNGIAVDTKALMKDVGKLNKSILVTFKGQTNELAAAMVKVKGLGMEMNKLDAIAGGLLDFESSIQAEMEAELLTGKNLNLERARQAALEGDLVTLAEELKENFGDLDDFQNMNRIQQEAMAKAVGMTREELSGVLLEEQAIASVGGHLNKQEKEAYEAAKEKYGAEKAAAMLKDGQLEQLVEEQTQQEKLAKIQEKMMELFVRIGEAISPIIEMVVGIMDALMPIVTVLSKIIQFIVKGLVTAFGTVGKVIKSVFVRPFEGIMSFLRGIIDFISGDFSGGLKQMGEGLIKIVIMPIQAIVDGLVYLLNGLLDMVNMLPGVDIGEIKSPDLAKEIMGTADDMYSPPSGYGKRVLTTEEGSIALNDKDTVIAGTKLGIGDDVMSKPNGGIEKKKEGEMSSKNVNVNVDLSPMLTKLDILINAMEQGHVIQMDGEKVGETLRIGSTNVE